MFAYNYPIAKRQLLTKCQACYSMFTGSQFEKIERYWIEECTDFEILEWKVGHHEEIQVHEYVPVLVHNTYFKD